jgi:hypothetical protein
MGPGAGLEVVEKIRILPLQEFEPQSPSPSLYRYALAALPLDTFLINSRAVEPFHYVLISFKRFASVHFAF